MTPRERELTAIRHDLPDRIPADAIWVENAAQVAEYLGIAVERVEDRLGIDGRVISVWQYTGELRAGLNSEPLTEWGTLETGDYGSARWAPLANANLADIARYPWPDPAAYDYAGLAEVARERGQTYALRGPYWQPLFCRACDLFGMEEAMARMLTDAAAFAAVLEAVYAHTAEMCVRLLDACGDDLPILCLGDDFATQRGLMIRPEDWRRWLKPYYAHLFALGKARGKVIWFHSCGDITAVLPDLLDIGLDVWETVQLHTLPMSAADLKREYGRDLTFFGGVNTQCLPFATPAEVREETLRCLETLGAGGGYICGPDHHVKPDVSPENTLALFETILAFQRDGYTRIL